MEKKNFESKPDHVIELKPSELSIKLRDFILNLQKMENTIKNFEKEYSKEYYSTPIILSYGEFQIKKLKSCISLSIKDFLNDIYKSFKKGEKIDIEITEFIKFIGIDFQINDNTQDK